MLQYWIDECLNGDAWSIWLLRYLNGGLADVPWVVAQDRG